MIHPFYNFRKLSLRENIVKATFVLGPKATNGEMCFCIMKNVNRRHKHGFTSSDCWRNILHASSVGKPFQRTAFCVAEERKKKLRSLKLCSPIHSAINHTKALDLIRMLSSSLSDRFTSAHPLQISTKEWGRRIGVWSSRAFQSCCTIKDLLAVEVHRVLRSCWQSEERALLCGRIQSIICQITRFPDQLFTQCVFPLVSWVWTSSEETFS